MKVPSPYRCDYCGKLKKEANHWWLRFVDAIDDDWIFTLFAWDDKSANGGSVEHICGQECAAKALGKWMAAQ